MAHSCLKFETRRPSRRKTVNSFDASLLRRRTLDSDSFCPSVETYDRMSSCPSRVVLETVEVHPSRPSRFRDTTQDMPVLLFCVSTLSTRRTWGFWSLETVDTQDEFAYLLLVWRSVSTPSFRLDCLKGQATQDVLLFHL